MMHPAYEMDKARRAVVLSAIAETCQYRGWSLRLHMFEQHTCTQSSKRMSCPSR